MTFPVIFELEPETGEATGTVRPFCSNECREAFIPDNLPHVAYGQNSVYEFGFVPKCEQCGAFVEEGV